ncbi:diguanylate cyclase [Desulfosporosinus sp.]|uniref:GGDEF domain-containing protein n=1 Tax=Desulfosporosinus sp. TaxID=157907 RepID=UPI002318FE34|nr:diguanylate cyclase [Desulfosporosinus sp.]MCO5384497.1 diguanylate cyclase [Desulfosporosinus sp.]MDA8223084.1 diguanylate cyclase [Desulfitobacterium hafniense]
MLNDLFLNGAIVIATISLGNQILINKEVNPYSPFKIKLFFSSMSGILGILLMINSVYIMPGVILDYRNIAILLSATYCGFISAIITALFIGIFRLFYTGLTYSSYIGAFVALIIGITCGLVIKLDIKNQLKWIYMSLCILLFPSLAFVLLISNPLLLVRTIAAYWISMSVVSLLVYYYVEYINLSKFTYRKYKYESSTDPRTGLNNVRQFDNELNKIIKELTDHSMISLLFIDIDHFKKVNDLYGHHNGDKVLEDLGRILLSTSKISDIISRNGGEEFSVLMTDCPLDKIYKVAERIRIAVQEHKFYLLNGMPINITISIGVAIYPYTVKDIHEIVQKADSALYEAKRTGRNKVVIAK